MSYNYLDNPFCGIRSSHTEQEGQNHRSSGDFSTEEVPFQATQFKWKVMDGEGNNELPNVSFDIMRDVSGGSDPVVYSQLKSGAITKAYLHRTVYVANPKGATEPFFVEAYPYVD